MRHLCSICLLLLLLPGAVYSVTIGELQFQSDLQTILDSSQVARKPVMIDFFTDWCYWCKVMDDSTFPDPYVQTFLQNFEMGKINAEVDTMVAQRYGVRSYPTFLLLRSDGTEIDRVVGYSPPQEFVTAIVRSLSGIGTLEDLDRRHLAAPEDLEITYQLAEKYMYRSKYVEARRYFNELLERDRDNESGLASTSAYRLAYMKYKEKDFPAAAKLYGEVVATYPASDEAEDAELMVPYCRQQARQFEQARSEYMAFLERHPDTEEREWIEEQLEKMK